MSKEHNACNPPGLDRGQNLTEDKTKVLPVCACQSAEGKKGEHVARSLVFGARRIMGVEYPQPKITCLAELGPKASLRISLIF